MIHIVKGFGVVNKAEVDVFLELSGFFYDPMDFGNLTSGSFAFSKSTLNIWKFSVLILLKPNLENFECYFARMWDECNCAVVWIFFGTAFLWDWNENWPFPMKRLSSVTYEVTKINADREKENAKGLHLCLYRKSPGGLETASVLTTDDIMTPSSWQISLSGQLFY